MTQNYFDLHYYVVTFKVDTSQLHITFFIRMNGDINVLWMSCFIIEHNSKVKNMPSIYQPWLGLKIQLLSAFMSNIIFVLILLWSLVIHIWLRVTVQASAYYPTLHSPWNKKFTHNSRHQAKMGLVISVFFILTSPFYFCFMIRILQGASIMNVSSSLFLLLISVQRGAEVKV